MVNKTQLRDNNIINKNTVLITTMIFIIIVLLFALVSTNSKSVNKSGVLLTNEGRENIQLKPITIQGFSEFHAKSDEVTQDFTFCNPKDNNCYMDIEFHLPDGTKLFEVKRIEPRYVIKKVEFLKTMKDGIYENCTFNINCYSMNDNRKLNGATMNVTLYVG